MENTQKKIVPLADDIRQIIVNAFGEDYEMIRLCKDHFDPFLHKDERPVLAITQDEFVGIFNRKNNHFFISPAQVLRLGEYCELALPNIIGLLLKAEWECFLSEIIQSSNESVLNIGSILDNQELIGICSSEFSINHARLFSLISESPGRSYTDTAYGHVDLIIRDLLEDQKFLTDNFQIDLVYSKVEISEKGLLHEVSDSQKETYLRLKEVWQLKSTEFDEMLLYLERKKRLNMNVENKYFETFGKIEAEKSEAEYRVEKYRIVLKIISDRSDLSLWKAVKMALTKMSETERKSIELQKKIKRSRNRIGDFLPGGPLPSAGSDYKRAYMQECKTLLKKLYFLLHSDTCPNYEKLSRKKQKGINTLWMELMKSTNEELFSFTPSMLLYSLPNYETLESIYLRACEMLGMDPEVFEMGNRLDFMIRKGSSIDEIVRFFEDETEKLELHLAHLELIQNEYTLEDQIRMYMQALENQDQHIDKLTEEIAELKQLATELKNQILNEYKNAA